MDGAPWQKDPPGKKVGNVPKCHEEGPNFLDEAQGWKRDIDQKVQLDRIHLQVFLSCYLRDGPRVTEENLF